MEKQRPNYDLKKIKSLLCSEDTRIITDLSRDGAVLLGYMDDEDMISVIEILTNANFYKSMTSNFNPKIWQDVYNTVDEEGRKLYIKLQISLDGQKAVLVQFKLDERGD